MLGRLRNNGLCCPSATLNLEPLVGHYSNYFLLTFSIVAVNGCDKSEVQKTDPNPQSPTSDCGSCDLGTLSENGDILDEVTTAKRRSESSVFLNGHCEQRSPLEDETDFIKAGGENAASDRPLANGNVEELQEGRESKGSVVENNKEKASTDEKEKEEESHEVLVFQEPGFTVKISPPGVEPFEIQVCKNWCWINFRKWAYESKSF